MVRERHIPIIEEAVELAYKNSLAGLQQQLILGLEDRLRTNFLLANYFGIVESIVQKTDEVKVFEFEPDLPISELASAGEQQHASKLVCRVQQHHAKQISALVKQRYAECSKVISCGLLQEFGDEIKLNWTLLLRNRTAATVSPTRFQRR